MTQWKIEHGDCRDVLRGLDDNFVDACVTDPPYELGFMGKKWDASGVAFQVETWGAVLRVLKPGAHLLAFGGTRTYHRLACVIEDAGFELRDSIHWIYGSGMPKAKGALKPAHEPVVLARKPICGAVAVNVARWGTGMIRIDESRVEAGADYAEGKGNATLAPAAKNSYAAADRGDLKATRAEPHTAGRWPANVILDEAASAELDAQQNGASRFFFVAKASNRERNTGCAVPNTHPTVKPVGLMRYLVRLVTPRDGIVIDPFCGSGTTGVASILEGLRFAGIEQSAEYVEIAKQRITYAQTEVEAA